MINVRILALSFVFALLSLAAPFSADAQSQNTETVSYTFKSGDNLSSFASRYLEGRDTVKVLQRINNIKDATKIRPGTVIKIPNEFLRGTAISAKVVAFSGKVDIAGKAPAIGALVAEGQTLVTGAPGFLTIAISGGSNVSIPSKSRVKIVRLRKYLLTGSSDIDIFVEQGRAETAAAPVKDANSRFRMRTPKAVSAVRGTVFRIGYDGPSAPSLTEVVEGSVAVESQTVGASALVPEGYGAALPKTGRMIQEELLPAPQVTNSGIIHAADTVLFNLSPVTGARGYHTQIARDAGFLEIFAETVSGTPDARFQDVPNGSFFVRSMAIADSGLEGLSDKFGFRRQLTKINASKSGDISSDAFRINWVYPDPANGKAVFRFQLFDTSRPELAVIDEPGLETSGITLTNLPSGSYRWRIAMRQTSPNGSLETWSVPQDFKITRQD